MCGDEEAQEPLPSSVAEEQWWLSGVTGENLSPRSGECESDQPAFDTSSWETTARCSQLDESTLSSIQHLSSMGDQGGDQSDLTPWSDEDMLAAMDEMEDLARISSAAEYRQWRGRQARSKSGAMWGPGR